MSIRWIFKENVEKFDWCVFRKDFTLEKNEKINIEVSSLDRYCLYVNGTIVSRGPVKSYNFKKYYDRVDVTKHVKIGKNSVAIVSQYASEAGVYARVLSSNAVITETDESWKTKKYEALDNKTEAKCPPLEPERLNEECFDGRLDVDVLSPDYDFNSWENAVFVHDEWSEISFAKGGAPSGEILYPEKFMGAFAVAENNDFGFRLGNPGRKFNDVRKCSGELYFFIVNSESERELSFAYGNIEKCTLNGEIISDKVFLKKGENLFVAYYFASDTDPYFIFKNTEALSFSEIRTKNGSFPFGLINLVPDSKFYGWAYTDESAYKDSDAERIISLATSAKSIDGVAEILDDIIPAECLKLSVSSDIIGARFGSITNMEADASLKIKTNFSSQNCSVSEPLNMLNGGEEFTKVKGNVAMFLDFGSEKLGYIKFKLTASCGTVVDLMGFEVVDFNGVRPMAKNAMRYICREGEQEFTSFYTRGMRYLLLIVKGANAPVKLSSVSLESAAHALGEVAEFSCDNEMINKIYDMCVNTAQLCMSDTYVDCPGYEQVFWVNDAKVSSEINLVNFGEYDYDYRCLELISESLSEDYKKFYRSDKAYKENKYLTTAAFGTYVYGGFPLASFHWGLGLCDYYLFSADLEGARRIYPALKKMLANCENMMSERGLFAMEGAWNLIEWAQNDLFPCGEVSANSALLAKLYKSTATLAKELGDVEFSKICIEKSLSIVEAINKYCWCEEAGAYVDTVRDEFGYELYCKFFKENGLECEDFESFKSYTRISEQTNVILKTCGCVCPEREERVKSLLLGILDENYKTFHSQPVENILKKDRSIFETVRMGTPFLLYYYFKALALYGEYEGILKVILRSYSYMIECGTNTCWETFYNPGADEWTRSICHGWGASPAIYLLTEIVGIKPEAPGFAEFSFKPNTAFLKKINAKIPTPHGFIKVNIDSEKNVYKLDYPEECKLVN